MDDLTTLLHDAVERRRADRPAGRHPPADRGTPSRGPVVRRRRRRPGHRGRRDRHRVAVLPVDRSRSGPVEGPDRDRQRPAGDDRVRGVLPRRDAPGPRLFREFHQPVPAGPGRPRCAGSPPTPDDPDYRTPWPAGAFAGGWIDYRRGLVTVVLNGTWLRDRPAGMSAAEAGWRSSRWSTRCRPTAQQRIAGAVPGRRQPDRPGPRRADERAARPAPRARRAGAGQHQQPDRGPRRRGVVQRRRRGQLVRGHGAVGAPRRGRRRWSARVQRRGRWRTTSRRGRPGRSTSPTCRPAATSSWP